MIGGPKPEAKIREGSSRAVWHCNCAACQCKSYSFTLYADGTVECGECGHAVPQLEVHIVPNLRRQRENQDRKSPHGNT